ncbi:hypothetical protein ACJX0J_016145, partial [Zea mays]
CLEEGHNIIFTPSFFGSTIFSLSFLLHKPLASLASLDYKKTQLGYLLSLLPSHSLGKIILKMGAIFPALAYQSKWSNEWAKKEDIKGRPICYIDFDAQPAIFAFNVMNLGSLTQALH